MILLDSNVIINSAKPDHGKLREFLSKHSFCVSVISIVEVLGFDKLSPEDRISFEAFFEQTLIPPVSDKVIAKAVELKQIRKMTLGDSLIAATAIANNVELITSNIRDFRWIGSLKTIDPLEK